MSGKSIPLVHRLLRCQVDLVQHRIEFYRLRRREPDEQPLIKTSPYHLPQRRFDTRPLIITH